MGISAPYNSTKPRTASRLGTEKDKREREREKETERQRDRETERERQRERDRDAPTHTHAFTRTCTSALTHSFSHCELGLRLSMPGTKCRPRIARLRASRPTRLLLLCGMCTELGYVRGASLLLRPRYAQFPAAFCFHTPSHAQTHRHALTRTHCS